MGKKVYVDLTHPFSAEIPRWPYFDKPEITNAHTMAKGGVLTSKITCTMHTGTHCDAPRHVMEYEFDGRRARYTHEMPIDAYTGEAVVLKLDVEPWTLITDKHLDEACKKCGIDPASLKGKVLCLNTGMHRLFDDSKASRSGKDEQERMLALAASLANEVKQELANIDLLLTSDSSGSIRVIS